MPKPMDKEQAEFFIILYLMRRDGTPVDLSLIINEDEISAPLIIQKRVDVLKLPIVFDGYALAATTCLVDSPGEAVVLLIDMLEKFEGKTVTLDDIANTYPMGFFDRKEMDVIVDAIKKGESTYKWANIY